MKDGSCHRSSSLLSNITPPRCCNSSSPRHVISTPWIQHSYHFPSRETNRSRYTLEERIGARPIQLPIIIPSVASICEDNLGIKIASIGNIGDSNESLIIQKKKKGKRKERERKEGKIKVAQGCFRPLFPTTRFWPSDSLSSGHKRREESSLERGKEGMI